MPMSKRIVRALGLSLVGALILAALCAGALIFGTDGADLSYRTLDYDVTATADGDLKVTEHIDIKLRKRKDDDGKTKPWKQLYQQYTLKTDNLTDITDISVRNVTNGIDYGHQASPDCRTMCRRTNGIRIMPIIGISPTLRMTMTIRSRMFPARTD